MVARRMVLESGASPHPTRKARAVRRSGKAPLPVDCGKITGASSNQEVNGLGSVIRPSRADAATVAGEAR